VYSLSQNYPNPFNPVTNIKFSIPAAGNVKLVIFDILGREVKTLLNDVKPAGNYVVDFNAAELSSGAYFYRLESGNFVETKKMLLVK
ncbi:MAG TPA: T9SS type A sorting domain-containing protein, partial [Ignavibacteria bacterium]|nr:T9SS type A sorting domain-containing protein [Ignavibacteria bacterium]HRJ05566.1 T9SS type A sorting domain-containing protein [Ignavibacteria bacterium]